MSNIADSPGKYTNFSGVIDWEGTGCEVKNATFEILEREKRFKVRTRIWVIFEQGVVISGDLGCADIKYCDFRGNTLEYSVFRDGIFDGGIFSGGYWFGGEWVDGEWEQGCDKFGRTRNVPPTMWDKLIDQTSGVANKPGRYENFSGVIEWVDSKLKVQNANFELGARFYYNLFFNSGTVLGGKACNMMVDHCVWKGGLFKSGWWLDGTWESGEWYDSYWGGGFDRSGKFHDEYDRPDLWHLRGG